MHLMNKLPQEVIENAASVFAKPFDEGTATRDEFQERFDAAHSILNSEHVLHYLKDRVANQDAMDVDFIAKVLRTRCIEIEADIQRFRRPKFFLDLFRERNLIRPIRQGLQGIMQGMTDYTSGTIRFIGDKTDDWPSTGSRTRSDTLSKVKYFANSVEYGILELWQAQCEGRDLVSERIEDALEDHEAWAENLITAGAPLHGLYGFLDHPAIAKKTVVASLVNGPATDFPSKTPGEIAFDLGVMRDDSRVSTNYNQSADTVLISDQRYSYIGTAEAGDNGETILARHLRNQQNLANGGLTNFIPFVPYDTAGPGATPIATTGTFDRQNIEFPWMPTERLPVEYHGSKWKIGFVGAAASINVKRERTFTTWEGI